MTSFLNARDSPSPNLQNKTLPVRESPKSESPVFRSAQTKVDFGSDENLTSGVTKQSVGRVTKPSRPMLSRRSRGASIFDMPGDTAEVTSTEVVAPPGNTSATRSKRNKTEAEEPVIEEPVIEEKVTKPQPKKAAPKKAATPAKPKPAPKKQVVTPKVRLTRSRSRSASPAVVNATEKSSESSVSSNGISPRSSQTLFSSQTVDKEAIDLDMEVDSQPDIEAQTEAQAEKEANDRIVFGPKKLFASEASGISGTSIFAAAPKRKIKQMRTSTPVKKKKEKSRVVDINSQTPTSSFASSFESSSQGGSQEQEQVRAPISVNTNKRTYGANRSYLADSPTKKETLYDSIMSESSDESEHEELNIKSVHELRETGGNARFMDEMEYLAEGLGDEGSSRRTTLLEICKKAKDADFIRKLKSTDYADKILHVLPQVVETDQVAAFLVLFIAQKIFADNGANVLDTVINDPKFLDSVFVCLENTESILRDKKSSKVFQKVLKEFVDGTTSGSDDEPTPSPALAAIATLSTLQTYPGASGSTILKACLLPTNWDKFRTFAINAFEEKEYKVSQLVVFFLDFCQSDVFFSSLAHILDDLATQLKNGKPDNALVDLSLPVLRLLIVHTNENSIPELDDSFVLKCISLGETLHKHSQDSKLSEVYLLCLGFLENIIGELTTDYKKVYDIFTQLARAKEDKHCQAFLTLLRKNVATRGGLSLSAKDKKELE